MSDKIPTAVEWIVEQLILKDRQANPNSFTMQIYFESNKDILKQAIEMEKQMIIKAVQDGFNEGWDHPEEIGTGEQYYNKTYG